MAGGLGDFRDALQAVLKKEYKSIKEDDLFLAKVMAINDDPGQENYGTVDLEPAGEEGYIIYDVRVNAVIEGAHRGKFTFPKLFSDVVAVKYAKDLDAAILLFSHVEKVEYIVDKEIITKVQKVTTEDPEDYEDVTEEDEFTQIKQTTTEIELKAASIKAGSDMAGTFEPMVLGNVLADLLTDLVDLLKAAKVTTSMGPQPFLPETLAKLEQVGAGIEDIKSQICQLQ